MNNIATFEDYKKNPSAAMVEVETQRAIAEVQAELIIAKRFPRDVISSIEKIKNACQRPKLAESSTYDYARGGTTITGPSIRLAEAIAQNWGNIQYGVRELEQRNGESTVEAFAWDTETNTRVVKQFQVKHWRDTKSGGYVLRDSRDIYERVANDGARRLRACILAVIPSDVVEIAVEESEKTLKANISVTNESISKMLEAFKPFGVDKAMIEKRIQRKIESILPAQFLSLKKIYASLNDGMSEPSDWFEVEQPPAVNAKGVQGLKNALKAKKEHAAPASDYVPEDVARPEANLEAEGMPVPPPEKQAEEGNRSITPETLKKLNIAMTKITGDDKAAKLDIINAWLFEGGAGAVASSKELTETQGKTCIERANNF